MELLFDPHIWLAFATLTALEIVLGIDNVFFISILVDRLPKHQQTRARIIGLSLAMVMRIVLLLSLTWLMGLQANLFSVLNNEFSIHDLILLGGGLFLLAKSTMEIHNNLEATQQVSTALHAGFSMIMLQIVAIDLVFSFDSIIIAIGLAQRVEVMIAAIVIAVLVMMVAANTIGQLIERHPTLKILALSFLLLIGTALIAEGLGLHIPKGYLYFAMAFSILVEILNIRIRKSRSPVKLNKPLNDDQKFIRSEN